MYTNASYAMHASKWIHMLIKHMKIDWLKILLDN